VCGIIGFLAKKPELRCKLGELVTPMIECMSSRGPDSAGLAVFQDPVSQSRRRYSLFCPNPTFDWDTLTAAWCNRETAEIGVETKGNHTLVESRLSPEEVTAWLADDFPAIHVLAIGKSINMFKDEGAPNEIARNYEFCKLSGTHAVGHTRMATESAVSPAHAHPFTAGEDFCLVHNGSLSNPHSIRRQLLREGIKFQSDNDTEAGCRYLEWRMQQGDTLEEAIANSFAQLDGFFTFLMATGDKMVIVRDAFACKPAVVSETDEYVAISSEFRSLAHLPDIANADVFEPQPEEIYSWSV